MVEIAEDQTDGKGKFTIPKYSTWLKRYKMAVYKMGYVCWNNEDIFPTFEKRMDFKLKSGKIIKLARFKEEYSKVKHADFTLSSSIKRPSFGIFDNAIKSEIELLLENERKRKKVKE